MRIDKNFWRAFFTKKIVRVCFAILVLFVLAAVFADLLAPYDPNAGDLKARLADPSAAHPFGTDYLGRDQLSRMIYGARIAMLIALLEEPTKPVTPRMLRITCQVSSLYTIFTRTYPG